MSHVITSARTVRRGMARCDQPGLWQIGIYSVELIANGRWQATATGPGTIGDGRAGTYLSLAEAYFCLTGETMPGARKPVPPAPAAPAAVDVEASAPDAAAEAEHHAADRPALDGRRADGKTWADALAWRVQLCRPDGSRFDRAQRAITAEDARYLASRAEPGCMVLAVFAAEDAPEDAEAEQLTAPGLAHADEWRTRRSTWIPLSVALAAALASFLPGAAGAAQYDPGFARAGADPASNAMALALWFAFMALAACLVLACAGTVRHGRRERDKAVLRVRCRRIAGR